MISAVLAAFVLLANSAGGLQATPDSSPAAKPATTPRTVSEATAVAGKTKAPDDPLAIICHSEPVLGSRLTVKRCTTKGDAAMNKFQQRQELERMQGATYHP
jgi:hypothetical protein